MKTVNSSTTSSSTTKKDKESPSPRAIVRKFLEELEKMPKYSSETTTLVMSQSSESSIQDYCLESYLDASIQITHPLMSLHQQEQSTDKAKEPTCSLDEALHLLQKQESRTCFGPLEKGILDDNQLFRHGYSSLPGFRGAVVQVFQLKSNRIASIYVRKTTAPWKQRWWWYRRRSMSSRRVLWQAWWDDWYTMNEEDEIALLEEQAFQQRLLETNFFIF